MQKSRSCSTCKIEKDASEFIIKYNIKAYLSSDCRPCIYAKNRARYKAKKNGVIDIKHHKKSQISNTPTKCSSALPIGNANILFQFSTPA